MSYVPVITIDAKALNDPGKDDLIPNNPPCSTSLR